MKHYLVKTIIWSELTNAFHYRDYILHRKESLEKVASHLITHGFQSNEKRRIWVMPGSIISIEQLREFKTGIL